MTDYGLIVPQTDAQRLHMAGTFVDGAVDIYAPPTSEVIAPADGWVEHVMYLRPPLFGFQIRGYVIDRRERIMGFVAAHLQKDTYPVAGESFVEGDVWGWIADWPRHPKASHVHLAFRVGGGMPPPGNIRVERALRRLGV